MASATQRHRGGKLQAEGDEQRCIDDGIKMLVHTVLFPLGSLKGLEG